MDLNGIQLGPKSKVITINSWTLSEYSFGMTQLLGLTNDLEKSRTRLTERFLMTYVRNHIGRGIATGANTLFSDNYDQSYNGSDCFLTCSNIGRPNDKLFYGNIANINCVFLQRTTILDKVPYLHDPKAFDVIDEIIDNMNAIIAQIMAGFTKEELEDMLIKPVLKKYYANPANRCALTEGSEPFLPLVDVVFGSQQKAYRYGWESCNLDKQTKYLRSTIQEQIWMQALTEFEQLDTVAKQLVSIIMSRLIDKLKGNLRFLYARSGATISLLFMMRYIHKLSFTPRLSCVPNRVWSIVANIRRRKGQGEPPRKAIAKLLLNAANKSLGHMSIDDEIDSLKRYYDQKQLFLIMDTKTAETDQEREDRQTAIDFLNACQIKKMLLNNAKAEKIHEHVFSFAKKTEIVVLVLDRISRELNFQFVYLKKWHPKTYHMLMNAYWLWCVDDIEWFREHNTADYKTLVEGDLLCTSYLKPEVFLADITYKKEGGDKGSQENDLSPPQKRKKKLGALTVPSD